MVPIVHVIVSRIVRRQIVLTVLVHMLLHVNEEHLPTVCLVITLKSFVAAFVKHFPSTVVEPLNSSKPGVHWSEVYWSHCLYWSLSLCKCTLCFLVYYVCYSCTQQALLAEWCN
jgi:hypothetical protein